MSYKWVDFKIQCAAGLLQTARDLLADAMGDAGFESFEETPSGIVGYIQDGLFDQGRIDEAIAAFGLPGVGVTWVAGDVPDRDWNEAWEKAGFAPVSIDGKVGIYDARTPQAAMQEPLSVRIEARQAFGTGTHQTTQMMVSTLLYIGANGKRVLDCGCGTGILGIVASLLGATHVDSYDIDPWSVDNTRHNAMLNGVGNLAVRKGDAGCLADFPARYDIVMANINRNILLQDMPAFKRSMAPGAFLLLSGFYEGDIPLLLEKAAGLGLEEVARRQKDEWRCLILR